MEVFMLKTPSGAMVPMDDEQAESLRRIKVGAVVKCSISEMRNGPFFRKWWTLVNMAFSMASERMQPREYKGHTVIPSFESFRKDITILAGYFDVTYKYDGTIKLEAQSLSWAKMDEDKFTKLYSATIDAILQKVLPGLPREELDRAVAATLQYA